MKTAHRRSCRRLEPQVPCGNSVGIEVVGDDKGRERFDELLGEFHYLGESRPVGDTLRVSASIEGRWVGLLMWGSAESTGVRLQWGLGSAIIILMGVP